MAIGLVVSAVVGYAVIAWLLAWLRRRDLTVFVVYRVILASGDPRALYFRIEDERFRNCYSSY